MKTEIFREALYSGRWGTVGPHFEAASEQIAEKCGGKFGVLTHSFTAALETVLRAAGLAHGDRVVMAAYCDGIDVDVTAAIGAVPVFADTDENGLLTADGISSVADGAAAVIVDASAGVDYRSIKKVCGEKGLKLVVNAAFSPDAKYDFDGITAVVLDLKSCGCAVVGREDDYASVFAWHHCGHAPGTGASLSFEEVVGGDMRVTEFQAIETYGVIGENGGETPLRERGYAFAPASPVLTTAYFRKMTGFEGTYDTDGYPNAKKL